MQWTTLDAGSPMAYYGLSADALTSTATGTSKTYGTSDLCGAPATTNGWVEPGTLQSALMTGLKPGTRYYYKFGQVRVYATHFRRSCIP